MQIQIRYEIYDVWKFFKLLPELNRLMLANPARVMLMLWGKGQSSSWVTLVDIHWSWWDVITSKMGKKPLFKEYKWFSTDDFQQM